MLVPRRRVARAQGTFWIRVVGPAVRLYCSCALRYRFYRAAKNVPVGLGRKSQFFSIMGLSYSALDLQYYWDESNETLHSKRIYIVAVQTGYRFYRAAKNVPVGLGRKSRFFFLKMELSYFTLDPPYYWEESNGTLRKGRIYKSCNCMPAGDIVSFTDLLVKIALLPITKNSVFDSFSFNLLAQIQLDMDLRVMSRV